MLTPAVTAEAAAFVPPLRATDNPNATADTEQRAEETPSVCDVLASAAEANNLPVGFFVRLIWQESRFNPTAISRAGAQGLAQFMPRVAAEMGLTDPFDPFKALPTSARFLATLKQQFGNLGLAAAAYNAGARRVREWIERKGKMPKETRDYVLRITGHHPEQWLKTETRTVAFAAPERAPCQDQAMADSDNMEAMPVPQPVRAESPAAAPRRAADDHPRKGSARAKMIKRRGELVVASSPKGRQKVAALSKTQERPRQKIASAAKKQELTRVKVAAASKKPEMARLKNKPADATKLAHAKRGKAQRVEVAIDTRSRRIRVASAR
jgi:Transglycosylase SLT domain